jgi:hypothetical protein
MWMQLEDPAERILWVDLTTVDVVKARTRDGNFSELCVVLNSGDTETVVFPTFKEASAMAASIMKRIAEPTEPPKIPTAFQSLETCRSSSSKPNMTDMPKGDAFHISLPGRLRLIPPGQDVYTNIAGFSSRDEAVSWVRANIGPCDDNGVLRHKMVKPARVYHVDTHRTSDGTPVEIVREVDFEKQEIVPDVPKTADGEIKAEALQLLNEVVEAQNISTETEFGDFLEKVYVILPQMQRFLEKVTDVTVRPGIKIPDTQISTDKEFVELVHKITESDNVELHIIGCNPDFAGPDALVELHQIVNNGFYKDRFAGATILDCLRKAAADLPKTE